MNNAINFKALHKQAEAGDEKAWKILHTWYPVVGAYSNKWTPSSIILEIGFDEARSHIYNEAGERREPTLDEYAEALKIYTDLAEKGYSKAIEMLLKWYSAGIYVKQDYKKCVDLLYKAELSNPEDWVFYADFDLAFCYANGLGAKKDFEIAYGYLADVNDVYDDDIDYGNIPMEKISKLYCGAHPKFLYPYHFSINEDFLDYCRFDMEDENATAAFALYRHRSDEEKISLLKRYDGLCQAELGKAYLLGLYGLEKDEKSAFENLWEAFTGPGDGGLREDEINLALLLAECYDKGIGTDADPDACAAVLSRLVFDDREYYRPHDPKIACLIESNYRDDVPEPRKTTLFGRATTLSEQQCAHYLFEKYKDEIEKRIGAEDAKNSLWEAVGNLPGPSSD